MASVYTKHSFKSNRELAADLRKALASKQPIDDQTIEEIINRLAQRPSDNHAS